MTVASGPIHHELRLFEPTKQFSKKEVGRLIFDVRMSQVCQLVIGPVEVRTIDTLGTLGPDSRCI